MSKRTQWPFTDGMLGPESSGSQVVRINEVCRYWLLNFVVLILSWLGGCEEGWRGVRIGGGRGEGWGR